MLQRPSSTPVTAEDWTPGDPQAPSEKGGQARAEILTRILGKERGPRRKEKARWHHLGLIRWGRET